MLSLDEIKDIRSLILSDRCTYKGSEFMAVAKIISALAREEATVTQQARVTPRSSLVSAEAATTKEDDKQVSTQG